MTEASRLVLGTVQLGMDYGVANVSGKPSQAAATDIVRIAWEGGIREFDTAQGYGDSERVLGIALARLGVAEEARVVSKPHPDGSGRDVPEAMRESLVRLGVARLHGVMWHREVVLDAGSDGPALSARMREAGLTRMVGVSVYSPDRAVTAMQADWVDMVQVPGNVFDRRFERAGVFDLARSTGKPVYVRSIFLQGLACMAPGEVRAKVPRAAGHMEALHALAADFAMPVPALCLAFVRKAYAGARVLVGVETREQLEDILAAWGTDCPSGLCPAVREVFVDVDRRVLNPSLWFAKSASE